MGIDFFPDIPDICYDKRHENRDVGHSLQCKFRRRSIIDGKRRGRVSDRREERGIAEPGHPEESDNGEERADTCKPDTLRIMLGEESAEDAEEDIGHTQKEENKNRRTTDKIMPILERGQLDGSRDGIGREDSVAIGRKENSHESEEENEEEPGGEPKLTHHPLIELLAGINRIDQIESGQTASEEKYGTSEEKILPAEDSLEAMGRGPGGNDRSGMVEHGSAVDGELPSEEEHSDSDSEEDATDKAIEEEENIIDTTAVEITLLIAIFIADSLHDEAQQNQHPEPIGTAEARRIEERESGESGSAESDESGESEFPLSADRIDNHLSPIGLRSIEQHRLPTLHKEQEDEDAS